MKSDEPTDRSKIKTSYATREEGRDWWRVVQRFAPTSRKKTCFDWHAKKVWTKRHDDLAYAIPTFTPVVSAAQAPSTRQAKPTRATPMAARIQRRARSRCKATNGRPPVCRSCMHPAGDRRRDAIRMAAYRPRCYKKGRLLKKRGVIGCCWGCILIPTGAHSSAGV